MHLSDIAHSYIWVVVALFGYMTAAFILSRLLGKRDDLADIAWGPGFIVAAVTAILTSTEAFSGRQAVSLVFTTTWALRLSTHILRRFKRTSGDPRYLAMQQKWGKSEFWRSYVSVFLIQGFLIAIVCSPVILASLQPAEIWSMVLGGCIWLAGFIYEATGDSQLSRFLANPANKGKLLTSGLWKYSRHPNYFGEITQCWGLAVVAISVPFGYIGLFGAATITFLIVKVSGVPLAEARYKDRIDWKAYAAKTSPLIPKAPRKL